MYTFRLRFLLPESIRLGIEDARWGVTPRVSLHAHDEAPTIRESGSLVLKGGGFSSITDAQEAGAKWRDALEGAFARIGVGANFGAWGGGGIATNYGLEMLEAKTGRRFLNDVLGLSYFESEPSPRFVSVNAQAVKIPSTERMKRAIDAALASGPHHSPVESLAYDLYSASFFVQMPDARLLMLMMAVEALIEPAERSDAVQAHVRRMIDATVQADIPQNERTSITSSLTWLLQESVGQAGRRLASRLDGRLYMDLRPDRFFTHCYALRSRLVHGTMPRPSFEEINNAAGQMELFVGHLLCPKILEAVPD